LVYDGQDMTHVELQLVDALGKPVADAYDQLYVRVEGGHLLGLENGDLADTTPYSSLARRVNKGRLLAYVGAPAGGSDDIYVYADGFGLKGAKVKISAKG